MPYSHYSAEEVREIARLYDGASETIEALLRRFGGARRALIQAAKRGGYIPKQRKRWTAEDDQFLRENWGRMPVAEIAMVLGGISETACNLRRKRIGVSSRDFVEYTVNDVEALLKIDHRIWQRFIEDGWLKTWVQPRRNATPVHRISIDNLRAFLTAHPEVFNYRRASQYVRGVLELDRLPEPPAYKRLTCRSKSYDQVVRKGAVGPHVHHGEQRFSMVDHHYSIDSCDAIGGHDFWAPLYEESPSCPRCGCKVSRFSEKSLFSDEAPDDEHLAMVAGKLGLRFEDGRFLNEEGVALSDEELLRYVFSTRRNPSKALSVFRRLIEMGLTVAQERPVATEQLAPSLLGYELRERQQSAFDEFVKVGAVGIYWPPGQGKMYFLGMAYTRLAGTHALFVHSNTILEQWVAHLRRHAPRVVVNTHWKPFHHTVDVFDHDGAHRCCIEVWNYRTAHDFRDRSYTLVGYDEAHFLPGRNAHRLSMVDAQFRIGLTATPFREDGQSDLIHVMSGRSIGEDWSEIREAGEIKDVPVEVLVVEDLEHKYAALGAHLRGAPGKVLVFSDSIEDGQRIALENRIPFVSAADRKGRLETIASHRICAVSRVADCGIDVPALNEVVEFNFHHGSRAQSLQRYGRLLHAERPERHTVMMTVREFELYHKRLTALEKKGFRITIGMCSRDARRRPVAVPLAAAPSGGPLLSALVAQIERAAA